MDSIVVTREQLLHEKLSGNYSCPHFVPPQVAEELAASVGRELDLEAAKALAEIAENFALALVEQAPVNPTAAEIRQLVGIAKLR